MQQIVNELFTDLCQAYEAKTQLETKLCQFNGWPFGLLLFLSLNYIFLVCDVLDLSHQMIINQMIIHSNDYSFKSSVIIAIILSD